MLFLVLPVISRRVCQSFRCDEYESDNDYVYYLNADSGLDCQTGRYRGMVVFAGIMTFIYPLGCPLLLFVMLFKYRGNLNPPGKDEHEVIEERKVRREALGHSTADSAFGAPLTHPFTNYHLFTGGPRAGAGTLDRDGHAVQAQILGLRGLQHDTPIVADVRSPSL